MQRAAQRFTPQPAFSPTRCDLRGDVGVTAVCVCSLPSAPRERIKSPPDFLTSIKAIDRSLALARCCAFFSSVSRAGPCLCTWGKHVGRDGNMRNHEGEPDHTPHATCRGTSSSLARSLALRADTPLSPVPLRDEQVVYTVGGCAWRAVLSH